MAPYTSLHPRRVRATGRCSPAPGLRGAFTAFAPLQGPLRPSVISCATSWGPEAEALAGPHGWLLSSGGQAAQG